MFFDGAAIRVAVSPGRFQADVPGLAFSSWIGLKAADELAGCATNAAVLAAAAASIAGPNVAGAAAGKVFAEVDALARLRGGRPETFAGLAGAGDLVATVVASGSRNRRAGELLSQGVSPQEIEMILGRDANLQTPAIDGLAALDEGRIDAGRWTATVTEPVRPKRSRPVRAA